MDLIVSKHRSRGRLTPIVGGGLALLVAGSLVTFTMLAERADLGLGNPPGIIPTAPDATAERTVVLPGSPSSPESDDAGETRVVAPLLPPIPIASVPATGGEGAGAVNLPEAPDNDGPIVAASDPDGSISGPGGAPRPSFAGSGDNRGNLDRDGCDDAKHEPQGKGRGHCKHSKSPKQGPRQQPAREEDPGFEDDDDDDDDDDRSRSGSGHGSGSGRERSAGKSKGPAKAKSKNNGGNDHAKGGSKHRSSDRHHGNSKHSDDSGNSNGSNNSGGSGNSSD